MNLILENIMQTSMKHRKQHIYGAKHEIVLDHVMFFNFFFFKNKNTQTAPPSCPSLYNARQG